MNSNDSVTSKTFDGITDLVIWAPIKEGFIDAFENITYESRLHQVAEALHKIRKSAREHELLTPFADTAKRIQTLLDFRIGVVNRELFEPSIGDDGVSVKPRRYMYLVATFDGPWEPYIRLIWKPLGRFLDLLLCNCEDYVIAEENTFEKYAKWIRDNQLDSAIFYSASGLTVKDQNYLSKLERYQRELPPDQSDIDIARMTSDGPEELADKVRNNPKHKAETTRLALEALTVLYRLADLYPPDRLEPSPGNPAEGKYLLRVAHSILADWDFDADVPGPPHTPEDLKQALRHAYADPLEWYAKGNYYADEKKRSGKEPVRSEVQKGLLSTYDNGPLRVSHGALFLLQIIHADKFRKFLKVFPFSWEDEDSTSSELSHLFISNIAFTSHGLTNTGLTQDQLSKFPVDFRDGMVERAEDIGDRGNNHPRRWSLPLRNWPPSDDSIVAAHPPVDISEIDVVCQFRTTEFLQCSTDEFISILSLFEKMNKKSVPFLSIPDGSAEDRSATPLSMNTMLNLFGRFGDLVGLKLLSVESGFRQKFDHFNFRDGLSQPIPQKTPDESKKSKSIDEVPYGDVLLGYQNSLSDPATKLDQIMLNGSFLAIRKISQDVGAFNEFLANYEKPRDDSQSTISEKFENEKLKFEHGELAARLVGRERNGTALIHGAQGNDFNYQSDPGGEQCPFSAHVRLANPRGEFQGRKDPRILRRGMMYGHRYTHDTRNEPRGLIFMAYNANLAEQFEVVQRWLNGANATDTYSEQPDPLTGDVIEGKPKTFRFIKDGHVHRVRISKPFTRVEWGAYLFAPSRSALKMLAEIKVPCDTRPDAKIRKGNEVIAKLESLDAVTQSYEWKLILEDFLTKDPEERALSSNVWEAIIARGGALRIESGVIDNINSNKTDHSPNYDQPVILVADQSEIMRVFSDHDNFSMMEQNNRCKKSVGPIFVSQDPGDKYYTESSDTNGFLFAESEETAFYSAYKIASLVLNQLKQGTQYIGDLMGKDKLLMKIELRRQFLRPTLGLLCKYWFGIPDGIHIKSGSWDWDLIDKRDPICPGDFMAPSRHGFLSAAKAFDYGLRHQPWQSVEISRFGFCQTLQRRNTARDHRQSNVCGNQQRQTFGKEYYWNHGRCTATDGRQYSRDFL